MSDEYVIMMQILSTKEFDGEQIADKVQVQLMLTDPEIRPKKRIVKKSEQDGLYNACHLYTSNEGAANSAEFFLSLPNQFPMSIAFLSSLGR